MYHRLIEPLFIELLKEFRIIYLTGPRQAGKTTFVRSVAEQLNMTYLTLDNQAIFESVMSDPHGFINSFKTKQIIIDEFQYVPHLITAIKEASDNLREGQRGQFILTGSALISFVLLKLRRLYLDIWQGLRCILYPWGKYRVNIEI